MQSLKKLVVDNTILDQVVQYVAIGIHRVDELPAYVCDPLTDAVVFCQPISNDIRLISDVTKLVKIRIRRICILTLIFEICRMRMRTEAFILSVRT